MRYIRLFQYGVAGRGKKQYSMVSFHRPFLKKSPVPPPTYPIRFNSSKPATSLIDLPGIMQVNPVWLRENCLCSECYNAETFQRSVFPHKFDQNLCAKNVAIEGSEINVTWSDGHRSIYDASWLQRYAYPGQSETLQKFLWDLDLISLEDVPQVNYNDYMNETEGLKTLLTSLLRYGYGFVCGAPATVEATEAIAKRICFIQETLYGRMWNFTSDMARSDTAYTKIPLGAHIDTTYFNHPAGIQMFHCLHHDGKGGETLLVDGFHAAEELRKNDKVAFEILCQTRVHHRYTEPGYFIRSLDPVLKVDPVSKAMELIRYNHHDREPISTVPQENVARFYEAIQSLASIIESASNEYWFKLRPGTVLLVDNWRVMHGRAGFTGSRRICGCYLPREDWLSRARTVGIL